MSDACIYCDAPATRWCDVVLGFDNADGPLASLDTEIFRCDAPLCEAHAVHLGTIFFHGSPAVTGAETIDHCCEHEQFWTQDVAGEWTSTPERFGPISKDEAARRRYKHRCQAAGPLRLVTN